MINESAHGTVMSATRSCISTSYISGTAAAAPAEDAAAVAAALSTAAAAAASRGVIDLLSWRLRRFRADSSPTAMSLVTRYSPSLLLSDGRRSSLPTLLATGRIE
eukprot:7385547-Prymnesium_polylepis.1